VTLAEHGIQRAQPTVMCPTAVVQIFAAVVFGLGFVGFGLEEFIRIG
jgi:hypothetical protein